MEKYIIPFLNIIPKELSVLYEINKYKKLIKQPFPLKNKNDIKYGFCVTPKFDGLRSQLYINRKKEVFIITNNFRNVIITNLVSNINNTLIDGELIDNKIFYAFDLIIYKNDMLEEKIFLERLNILEHDISIISDKDKNTKLLYKIKEYYFNDIYNNSKKIIRKKYNYIYDNKKYQVPTDGLIFMNVKSNYLNSIIFKWKRDITFDFKIEKLNLDNKKEQWCLKCYNKNNDYVIFKDKEFIDSKIAKKYENNDIVEFKYNKNKKVFIPIKNRKDKYLPNFIDIANDNMDCILKDIKF
jgi:ATP-dependent DNA ligase